MTTRVTAVSAAGTAEALAHFEASLRFETDCWDVHESLSKTEADFVLLDVRSAAAYANGHVPGALSLPYAEIAAARLERFPLRRPSLQRRPSSGDPPGPLRTTRQDHDRWRRGMAR